MTFEANVPPEKKLNIWQIPSIMWAVIVLCAGLLGVLFYDGLEVMVTWWFTREEYGHGIIIPFITAFLIWQKKDLLECIEFKGSIFGLVLVALGLVIFFLGELASIYIVIQYAFIITVYGMALSLMGGRSFKLVLAPFLMLLFMLPIPGFLFNSLSSYLQLISSQIGVMVIRAFDISVYLEGNVIDLGVYKLQVVEACSGLNYLFPLMTLGFIAAYFFTGALWKKAIIFLSTIPITVFMNSLRIGLIGISVEYWGISMAEGILHDFEGWVVFMGCTVILVLEMWILAQIGTTKLPLREAFGMDFPEPSPDGAVVHPRLFNKMFFFSIILLVVSVPSAFFLGERVETIPERKVFADFPMSINGWEGKHNVLENIFIDKLKLTDYALINYSKANQAPINFYSAYYESQRKESTTHSPRSCIPGGGWDISVHEIIELNDVFVSSQPLSINRLVIEKDEVKQLVYYWFKQRDRIITNEQLIKWYFFVDSLKKQRTDGALIRVTTFLPEGASLVEADKKLVKFVQELTPLMSEYVPD